MAHALLNEATAILGDLIAFPSVSQDSNADLIDYLQRRLELVGARVEVTRDVDGGKANIFATIGPADMDGGVVLSGHSDVVPVEGQDWSSDPFAASLRDGRVYGRGACDMKGFIACAMASAPLFAEAELTRPLHLAFTYDEEVGCLGAQVMLDRLAQTGPRPAVCIVGEPTGMAIIEGHKGCCEYTTTFSGTAGHASQPDLGVNAIEYATRYIARLLEIGGALRARAPAQSRFDPPWSTIQVGRIAGGAARNIIAESCAVEWELRPINSADFAFAKSQIEDYVESHLLPRMRAVYPGGRYPDLGHRRSGGARADERVGGRSPRPHADRQSRSGHLRLLRHRSGPVPAIGHFDRHLRPRLHRPGAQGRRICGTRPARCLSRYDRQPAAPARPG